MHYFFVRLFFPVALLLLSHPGFGETAPASPAACFEQLRALGHTQTTALSWSGNHADLMLWLSSRETTGPAIIEWLSQSPKIKALYEGPTGVDEGYSLREHTLRVFQIYESQRGFWLADEPAEIEGALKFAIAVHDLGKPLAVATGDKDRQHEFTVPLLGELLEQLKFPPKKASLIIALIDHDLVGQLVQGRITIEQARAELTKKATDSRLSLNRFIALQSFFYVADAASYPRVLEHYFEQKTGRIWPRAASFRQLQEPFVPEPLRKLWGEGFSSPLRHDPQQFRYFVHASSKKEVLEQALKMGFAGRTVLSVSVIDQDHSNTFAISGIIVDVPAETLFAAHTTDMVNSHPGKEETLDSALKRDFDKYGLPSPAAILAGTSAHPAQNIYDHNEALAVGQTASGATSKVTGLFVRTDSLGAVLMNADMHAFMRELARANSLPLIYIGPSRGYVTVRTEVIDRFSVEKKPTAIVHASPEQFAALTEEARSYGKPVTGISTDFLLVQGVFSGDRFQSNASIPMLQGEVPAIPGPNDDYFVVPYSFKVD